MPAAKGCLEQTSTTGTRPEAPAEQAELGQQVRRALTRLPQQQAEAFWLRHLEELSVPEVAEQLQITESALAARSYIGQR